MRFEGSLKGLTEKEESSNGGRRIPLFRFMGDRYKGMRTMRKKIAGNIINRDGLNAAAMGFSLLLLRRLLLLHSLFRKGEI